MKVKKVKKYLPEELIKKIKSYLWIYNGSNYNYINSNTIWNNNNKYICIECQERNMINYLYNLK